MENKRGQGLSTSTIILIILGVIILVILIIGFTLGWDKLAFWIPKNNVQDIQTTCAAACATNSVYNFCTYPVTLRAEDLPLDAEGKVQASVTNNCNYFANEDDDAADYVKYGIAKCPGLCPAAS